MKRSLNDLPAPPPGKTGWPWTVETPLAEASATGAEWPRISIVTPSYNQGAFLEETIRSVLLQGYPNLEYIVMDGGSTDGSVEVLRSFGDRVQWVSQNDGGQSDAINQGFARLGGDVLGWLNSDDTFAPGAFRTVMEFMAAHPDVALVYGDADFIDARGNRIGRCVHVEPFEAHRPAILKTVMCDQVMGKEVVRPDALGT